MSDKSLEMKKNNRGKYALVTGATSGFGYELARLLAKDGYNLVLVARTGERLDEIAIDLTQTFFIEVLPIAADLFNPSSAKDIYEEVITKGITIDILINDAGQSEHGNFIEYDLARDMDLIQLNITSVVCLTKLFLKDMVARNEGKVLQVASLLGKYPTPLMTVYAATKAFIISFTEGLINELQGTGVTVTALMPGASDTDFFHKAGAENTVTYREEELSKPEDVALSGYLGLMNGERRVIAGAKNKMYAAMSNLMPDGALASTMRKKMSPSEEPEGRDHITHGPSIEERDEIERATGKQDGDYDEHEDHIHNK
jgi:short-subunit dehydrogenase